MADGGKPAVVGDKPARRAPPAFLPEKDVEVTGLGALRIRGLRLRDRLRLALLDVSSFEGVAQTLAASVVYPDTGEPVYDADEWEAWGATHFNEAMDLWQTATDISGLSVNPETVPKV